METGYTGDILQIDLTNQSWKVHRIDPEIRRRFLGGRGLGIWLLSEIASGKTDPYSKQNVMIFMTGPYTGTGVFSAFYNVTTNSPLTGLAACSHSGGTWGPSLKRAGFDGLIIEGAASRPTYLLIQDGSCTFLEADQVWGHGVRATQSYLQNQHGKVAVAAIGPAGENRVRFASIINDLHRAAGRGGVGAVMGSKNLKAIAVGGSRKIRFHNQAAFMELSRRGAKKSLENARTFAKYGTTMVLALTNEMGALPTRNFRAGRFERADEINGDALKSLYFIGTEAVPIAR